MGIFDMPGEERVLYALREFGPQDRESIVNGFFPNASDRGVSKLLQRLKREGKVTCDGRTWSLASDSRALQGDYRTEEGSDV